MLSIVQLAYTKLSLVCAHNCHSCPQEMWESMGVKWEWTWYSQTVHAYTEPDLVGANAGSVGLSSRHCFPAAWASALHVYVVFASGALHWASTAAVSDSASSLCTTSWMHRHHNMQVPGLSSHATTHCISLSCLHMGGSDLANVVLCVLHGASAHLSCMLADHGIQRNSRSALMASPEVLFAGPLQLCHSPEPIRQHHRLRHQQQLCLIKLCLIKLEC